MSIRAISWVLEHSRSKHSNRLTLIAIASHADDQGTNAYPSIATLTTETGLCSRQVQRSVAELIEAGELIAERRPGRGSVYRLAQMSPPTIDPGDPRHLIPPTTIDPPKPATNNPDEDQMSPPPTTIDPDPRQLILARAEEVNLLLLKEESKKEPPPKRPPPKSDGFAEWYAGYPHKVGKAAAQRAWKAALRLATPEVMTAGRDRYVASKPPDRPWCNPATWLTQERWDDQPAPVSNGKVNGKTPELPNFGTEDAWRRRLADYRKSRFWNQAWGFPPDDPDCYAPAALLVEYGFADAH